MRGIFCLFEAILGFCYQACWSFFPATRVRPRELPELWTAHYKGQQICGFCGLRYDPDNATVCKGRINREAATGDSERLAE